MSKELEALEKINHTICLNNITWGIDKYDKCDCQSVEEFIACHDIIETELKAKIKKDKKIKALEIIKEKRVDARLFSICAGYKRGALKRYNNNAILRNMKPLTQEEYDLLKEVLL